MTQIARRRNASSDRESEERAQYSARKNFLLDFDENTRTLLGATHASRFLIDSRISSNTRRVAIIRAVFRRVAGWAARVVTVLGQGCLGPITIARADTQQCAFLTSDSLSHVSHYLAPLLDDASYSLFLLVPLYLSLGPTWALSRRAPTKANSGVRMFFCPFHEDCGGALGPLLPDGPLSRLSPRAALLTGRAFFGAFRSPCGRRHSAFSIFEYRGIATAMTSLRITSERAIGLLASLRRVWDYIA